MAYPGPPEYGQVLAYPAGPEQHSREFYANNFPMSQIAATNVAVTNVTVVEIKDSTEDAESDDIDRFPDKVDRHSFINKVYLILTVQLLVTVGVICVFYFVKPINNWMHSDGLWYYIVAYVTLVITCSMMLACPGFRRNFPWNLICLCIFTLSFSNLAATMSSFHETDIIIMTMGNTTAVCLAVSVFAIQNKLYFGRCFGFLFALLMVLFFFGWTCLIVHYVWGFGRVPLLYCGLSGVGALIFAWYLVFETQMIIALNKYELYPGDYIDGALLLYLDVAYLFLYLMKRLGKCLNLCT